MKNITISEPCSCNETGQRTNNEDSIYPLPAMSSASDRLFLVCDGIGGHEKGEVASQSVARSIADYWAAHLDEPDGWEKVYAAVKQAADYLSLLGNPEEERSMGTTVTLLSIGSSSVSVAHIGDSRIYQIRPGKGIVYKTRDHSLVQKWVDAGLITPEEARVHPKKNVITQAVMPGKAEIHERDVEMIGDIADGDYFFLCTDGITESVDDGMLVDIVGSEGSDWEKMERIKDICREHSRDNYSAYLIPIHWEEGDGREEVVPEAPSVSVDDPVHPVEPSPLYDDPDLRNRRIEQDAEALLQNAAVAPPEESPEKQPEEPERKEEPRTTASGPKECFSGPEETNRHVKTGAAYYIDYVCGWIKGIFGKKDKL